VVALGLAGIVLASLFEQHIQRESSRRLIGDLNRLAALVEVDGPDLTVSQPMSDPRFEVPYGGIYWQVRDLETGDLMRSRSTWDKELEGAPTGSSPNDPITFSLVDPEGSAAIGVGRELSFDLMGGGVRRLQLVVAEDTVAMNAATLAYRVDLFKALLVLAVILTLAAWAQVTLGLAPLATIRRGLADIRAGTAIKIEGRFPSEVQPLVSEVNDLTQAQEVSIQFARERAADLAHGLKGQLQVLNATAHSLREAEQSAAADTIEALTTQMAGTIDHQLGLARLRRRAPATTEGSSVELGVEQITRTLKKSSRGEELQWIVAVRPEAMVLLDGPDLTELLGALLENAAKWASSTVRVSARTEGGDTLISIEDDGPGMAHAEIERLGRRGVRIDESRSGTGIGISIAREVVALNDGELIFGRSALGGLEVQVRLPSAH
jgi:signal transduction histidine kinase